MAVKRRKPPEPVKDPTAAPGWALTFGDLMTQLLTFFILLFSVSEVKTIKLFEVFQSFRSYLRRDVPQMGYTIRTFGESMKALDTLSSRVPSERGQSGKSREQVEHPFGEYVEVLRVADRLELVVAAETLFAPGTATVTEPMAQTLLNVARNLLGSRTRVEIVGHASPVPLPPDARFADQMELAYARARAVYDTIAGSWRATDNVHEIRRLKVSALGAHAPPRDFRAREKYDRVEIIITADYFGG